MITAYRACSWVGLTACGLICFVLQTGSGRAEGFRLESAGVRGGLSANPARNEFHQVEFFGNWNLPWGWDLGKEWHLQSRLDLSAGWVGDSSQNAAMGTLGPTLVLGRARWPVSVEGGVSPTLLSSYKFAAHWRLGYRFQHMSNASLSRDNPGLNLHLLALSYCL